MAGNVLRVAAVGDFGALHFQPVQKFDRSTQLQFCTSPPIEATRCYQLAFLSTVSVNHCHCSSSVSFSLSCWSVRLGVLFFFKALEKYFEIHSLGSERWKLFCNFWFVRWLVRIANVLTPARWLLPSHFDFSKFL